MLNLMDTNRNRKTLIMVIIMEEQKKPIKTKENQR